MMTLSKLLLAIAIATTQTSGLVAFQHNNFIQRWPHIRRHGGKPSKLCDAALPVINDETYPSILPRTNSAPIGVIFDMDGTLIQHAIDFADMRERIYAVADADSIGQHLERGCVLELAQNLSPEGVALCKVIFDDIEAKALDAMKIMPGGADLVRFLGEKGLKRAVLTRNLEKNIAFMRKLYLDEMGKTVDEPIFHPIVARDTRSHPDDERPLKAKPAPDGILHICNVWGCHPSEVLMVGDSSNDDVTAANRAGCGSVLLTQPGGKQLDTDSGYEVGHSEEEIMERTPSLRVESLLELQLCLEAMLNECGDVITRGNEGHLKLDVANSNTIVHT